MKKDTNENEKTHESRFDRTQSRGKKKNAERSVREWEKNDEKTAHYRKNDFTWVSILVNEEKQS